MTFLERVITVVFVFATLSARAAGYDMPVTFDILYTIGFVLLLLDAFLDFRRWRKKRSGFTYERRRHQRRAEDRRA